MLRFFVIVVVLGIVFGLVFPPLERRHNVSKIIAEAGVPETMASKLKRIKRERLESLLSADDTTLIEFSKQNGITDCSPKSLEDLRKCLKKIYWEKYELQDLAIAAASSNKANKSASVVKKGAAGAIIAGPTGAIIGAASAIDKNMKDK